MLHARTCVCQLDDEYDGVVLRLIYRVRANTVMAEKWTGDGDARALSFLYHLYRYRRARTQILLFLRIIIIITV